MAGFDVFPLFSDNLNMHLGYSPQAKYLLDYLKDLDAKTCVLEKEYIDKDYMVDYQKFYSRSFRDNGKFTKRIHFFKEEFSPEKFKKSLEDNDTGYLNDSYAGFVVIRPITNIDEQPLIGRTLLKNYTCEERGDKRYFVIRGYPVSLFGIPLKVESLPFQVQDRGVSACATIALWSALYPLADTFSTPRYSPAEITEVSTSFPSVSRKFPSSGLNLEQMVNCVRLIGLDVEAIDAIDDDTITTAVKSYIEAGFPLIAVLELTGNTPPVLRHAAVISGYRRDNNGNLNELYVHDDQIGPYSRVKPDGSFKYWKNEWNDAGYRVKLEKLLIPIYPKIRLPFMHIYTVYQGVKTNMINSCGPDWDLRLSLTSIQDYKKFLLKKSIEEKEKILTKSLPRFIWIMRLYNKDQLKLDFIYDGTSVYPKKYLIRVQFSYG